VRTSPLIFKAMTVQINVDEKQWAEAESIAHELNIDYEEMFINTLRSNLYSLREAKARELTISKMDQIDREAYSRQPVTDRERDEMAEWQEIQDWGEE